MTLISGQTRSSAATLRGLCFRAALKIIVVLLIIIPIGEVRLETADSSISQSAASAAKQLHLPGRDLWKKSSVWRLLPPQKEYPQHMNEFTILGKNGPAPPRSPFTNRNKVRIIKSSHYELKYTLGRKIVFICVAKGRPRPQITWFKDGIELYNHNFFKVHEWRVGHRMFKSKMEIDPATPMDIGYYECLADNFHSVDVQGFRTEYKASSYTDPAQRG